MIRTSPLPVLGGTRPLWVVALALAVALWLWGQAFLPFAFDYPKSAQIPAARWIGGFITWLVKEAAIGPIAFADLTRAVSTLIDIPYQAALGLLADGVQRQEAGQTLQLVPPLSWLAVIGIMALFAHWAGGAGLALLVTACWPTWASRATARRTGCRRSSPRTPTPTSSPASTAG